MSDKDYSSLHEIWPCQWNGVGKTIQWLRKAGKTFCQGPSVELHIIDKESTKKWKPQACTVIKYLESIHYLDGMETPSLEISSTTEIPRVLEATETKRYHTFTTQHTELPQRRRKKILLKMWSFSKNYKPYKEIHFH